MSAGSNSAGKVFWAGVLENNPIFVMVLGICSSLAVTTTVKNSFVMFLGVAFATVLCSTVVSLLRHRIPPTYRMMVYMMVASTLVIVFDRLLKITLPAISKELGPYVGLIITNCIVMGRAEAYGINNPPILSAMDALGSCTGYGAVLIIIGCFREVFGMGTFLGLSVMPASYEKCGLLISAPGAFLCLAMLLLLVNVVRERLKGEKA